MSDEETTKRLELILSQMWRVFLYNRRQTHSTENQSIHHRQC